MEQFKEVVTFEQNQEICRFADAHPIIKKYLENAPLNHRHLIQSLIATGDGETLFRGLERKEQLDQLVEILLPAHEFYASMGGLLAYYKEVVELIKDHTPRRKVQFEMPCRIDISEEALEVDKAIIEGIRALPEMAEIYPVGGAGDRLNLSDESSGEPLPAAQLQFAGKTLLEGLIRDLEAKEYLYFKLFNQKVITPIVLMTSFEKNNHAHILEILEKNHWFNRPKETIHLVVQPLVPVITEEGYFSMKGPLNPVLKPGGHGVLWKLCQEQGAFSFLKSYRRKKALVRQINNPIAGTDYGLLAFCGIGCMSNKLFGFASCPRLVHAAEGMNVKVVEKKGNAIEVSLRNIEYTDFKKNGIKDIPNEEGSPFSKFPANTNLLFIDIAEIQLLVEKFPLPGKIINMKNKAPFIDPDGTVREVPAGRLESMMQNISDYIVDSFPLDSSQQEHSHLKTFLTYCQREKTISVTKKSYRPDQPIEETPEGAFYTLQKNALTLLKSCGIDLPRQESIENFLATGPNVLFLFHPALGPLWSIIRQKIQGGRFSKGSELQLELAEVKLSELDLKGSLLVRGDLASSRIELNTVSIKNRGIDRDAANRFTKNVIHRKERLEIILEPNAEFIAEGVAITGDHKLVVPTGYRMRALEEAGAIVFRLEKLEKPINYWNYAIDAHFKVELTL